VICGADDFVAIQQFGEAKERWLRTFLDLENGIPSHDTIGRVLRLLDPQAFEDRFMAWVGSVAALTDVDAGRNLHPSGESCARPA